MQVPEYMAAQTERMIDSLAHFLNSTQPEKQNWQPRVEGSAPTRSALEQIAECVLVNRVIAGTLRGETPPPPATQGQTITFETAEEAEQQLRASGAELAAAIRSMTEEDLERTYQHPRGQFLGANVIMMSFRNMAYHAGQINLIQMLAGDPEFHVPPKWR